MSREAPHVTRSHVHYPGANYQRDRDHVRAHRVRFIRYGGGQGGTTDASHDVWIVAETREDAVAIAQPYLLRRFGPPIALASDPYPATNEHADGYLVLPYPKLSEPEAPADET